MSKLPSPPRLDDKTIRLLDIETHLASVSSSPDDDWAIREKTFEKTVLRKLLGVIPGGEVFGSIIDFSEDCDDAIRRKKVEALLADALNRIASVEADKRRILEFIMDPWGSTLYNKIKHILYEAPPDERYTQQLASVLVFISDSDFIALYDQHRFVLGILGQTSPQGLALLADHNQWPAFSPVGVFSWMERRLISPWEQQFAEAYCRSKGVEDAQLKRRCGHVVRELVKLDLMECLDGEQTKNSDGSFSKEAIAVYVSPLGREILPYIALGNPTSI
jgi:hypothetical protein